MTPGIVLNDTECYVYPEASRVMLTSASMTFILIWKQARYPSVGEWINKICYIYEHETLLRENEIRARKSHEGNMNENNQAKEDDL